MTKDDIIRMARETGLLTEHNYREIINFGSMVAAAEREACAKACEEYAHKYAKDDVASKAQAWMMLQCAAAIRARGQHGD